MPQKQIPDAPDFLGLITRVQIVSNLLENAQEQIQGFEAERILNGREPTDVILGHDGNPVATGETYEGRARRLNAGIRTLMEKNSDIRSDLQTEARKRVRARERHFEQDEGLRRYASTPAP